VRLLFDEMLSSEIARQLRSRGHDATAVDGDFSLRGLSDQDIFDYAQLDERVIVTYNRDDFLALDRQFRGRGREHNGIVILNPRRFPQGVASIGALVLALSDSVLTARPYPSFVHWLQ
jgi:hypothetical protein